MTCGGFDAGKERMGREGKRMSEEGKTRRKEGSDGGTGEVGLIVRSLPPSTSLFIVVAISDGLTQD